MKKMKFLLATIIAIGITNFTLGQTTWNLAGNTPTGAQYLGSSGGQDVIFKSNSTERMRILGSGTNLGSICMGTTAPNINYSKYTLQGGINPYDNTQNIWGEFRMTYPFGAGYANLRFYDYRPSEGYIMKATSYLSSPPSTTDYFSINTVGKTIIGNTASTGTMLELPAGNINFGFSTFPTTSLSGGYKLAISGHTNVDGSLVIGTTSSFTAGTPFPSGYKLYVADGILTEKLKVSPKTTADWADYVFEKNYKLRSLSEVEKYVSENKHLPGVPSAQEVVDNGIDVAKMDAKLLEKIEELTLYMLQQQKQLESQQKQIEELKELVKK